MWHLLKDMRKKDKGLAFLAVLLIAGQVFLDLKLPDYTKEITVLISSESNTISDYLLSGGKMLACALGSALLAVIVGYLAAKIAADFSHNVRGKVFHKVFDFGAGEISKFSTSSLITRTTNDITQIQMLVAMGLQVMIKAPIMAAWAIVKIVGKSWQLSVLTASAVVLIMVVIGTLMAVTRENLTGLKVVRAFNAEKYQEDKFENVNENLMKTQMFTMHGMAFLFPVMIFVQSALSLGIYWLGAKLVDDISIPLNGTMTEIFTAIGSRADMLGDVVAFNSYALYVVMAFVLLLMIFVMLPRAQVSAGRINEVLNSDIAVREGKDDGRQTEEKGSITFNDVSFRYPGAAENCLEHISFQVNQGETLAIIGATGSGKSTLAGLAARLYDASEGEVLIDGKNVKDYSFRGLYDKMGYVTQKAVLFSDTIEGNVAFGEAAQAITEEDVKKAIDISQAQEFIDKMEEGLYSHIAQSGGNVSGGQKQRLSIARAIARNPEILIFDDSFSALDYKTDKELRRRLSTDLKGTTCVIVAQRIGTIRHADKIIVLDDGKMAGIGTHEELMKNCEVYQEIALSQLSKAELA